MLRIGLAGILLAGAALGQQYMISTHVEAPMPLSMPALDASLREADVLPSIPPGSLYFSDG